MTQSSPRTCLIPKTTTCPGCCRAVVFDTETTQLQSWFLTSWQMGQTPWTGVAVASKEPRLGQPVWQLSSGESVEAEYWSCCSPWLYSTSRPQWTLARAQTLCRLGASVMSLALRRDDDDESVPLWVEHSSRGTIPIDDVSYLAMMMIYCCCWRCCRFCYCDDEQTPTPIRERWLFDDPPRQSRPPPRNSSTVAVDFVVRHGRGVLIETIAVKCYFSFVIVAVAVA
mmetsp:Transcript_22509/g.49037  ORF Transcript_22509/g.49037 Transcript_22509/m.49037 type:complete len:226 (+) Transcript_22509:374-1051(+)